MNIWEQFKERAAERIGQAIEQVSPTGESVQGINVGETIFDAIYQYGRGKTETAQQRLVEAFRGTRTGQNIEREATQQRLMELMPWIIIGAALIIGAFFFIKR